MGSLSERVATGEVELWEDESFLRALVENTSEGLLTIDTDSVIVFANPAIERILGYDPAELVGSSKMTLIPERLRDAHQRGLQQYIDTGERHFDWDGVELVALHADGHEVPVSVSLREHEYDGERLFTGIVTDITEQKRRERQLRQQNEELEEFADVLSHDLRNPLTVAQAHLRMARENHSGESERLQTVDRSLERIDDIVTDMLARAREETVDVSGAISLRDVVVDAWETVATANATLDPPDPKWRVRANRSRVRQLVENLMRNSVEHGSPGPPSQAREDAVEHGGEGVTVRVRVFDDGTGFVVEDDGTGFPPEIVSGTSAAESRERGRYGLYIVGTVAAEHGWSVSFAESESGGARVEFTDVHFFTSAVDETPPERAEPES
ncbi:PAS domain S-box protein [Halocalculus aciditolerans]|uniref:histidine kinase n=1 Tax=Halocalculus aciditolerans TaxID=1383812 RepID=A0A830FHC5_9EURY|nr:PAS domain-containing sensor histidine kinase [Halocalculus aciditolerans]GGL47348.1 hypothetical protein GCM10009039_02030 [Halocalculus aciditolerans]